MIRNFLYALIAMIILVAISLVAEQQLRIESVTYGSNLTVNEVTSDPRTYVRDLPVRELPIESESFDDEIVDQPQSESDVATLNVNASTLRENTNTPSTEKGEAIPVTGTQIIEDFVPRFEQLQLTATEALTDLIDIAVNDYYGKKGNNESISYFRFYRTYYSKARELENEIDERFEKKFEQLQLELDSNGFSKEKGTKFKDEYEQVKKEFLKELMNRVTDRF